MKIRYQLTISQSLIFENSGFEGFFCFVFTFLMNLFSSKNMSQPPIKLYTEMSKKKNLIEHKSLKESQG